MWAKVLQDGMGILNDDEMFMHMIYIYICTFLSVYLFTLHSRKKISRRLGIVNTPNGIEMPFHVRLPSSAH